MKLRNYIFRALLGSLLTMTAQAQQTHAPAANPKPSRSQSSESIDVGGTTLRLGMAQDYVMQRLREHYDVQEIGTPTATGSSWLAEVKTNSYAVAVANVGFVGGQLSSVYKYWTGGSEPDTEVGFANALYGAITRFEQQGKTPCEVTTNNSQQPAGEVKGVFVSCKERQKYLRIDVVPMGGGKEGASLAEVLEYPSDELAVLKEIAAAGAAGTIAHSSSASTKAFSTSQTNQPAPSLDELEKDVELAIAEKNRAASQPAKPTTDAAEDGRREAAELANASTLVTVRAGERMPDEELSRIAAHNRALCDQTVTIAGLTPNGLALYVPPLGQKFMAKNSQNYPRMCLLEDATNVLPGVPRYLLVYAYSEDAFAGFQPVTQVNTTTTPVSGSGTVRNAYGDAWNFAYYGTVETTEMDTIEAPYVIRSHSLYLNAYDENGTLISRHSVTVSSQIGGNGASAIGYNGAQLIALLWNNPSHLIKSVLKDVQKDSRKYSKN